MHLLIAFGCLVEAFWMSFSWLFATFWKPFGTFWTPWASLFRPRDDSWPIWGPGCKKLRKKLQFGWTLVAPGVPNLKLFCCFWWLFSSFFFVVFLGAYFSYNLQFRGPFGIQSAMLFGVPGTLGNKFKTLKGIRFSHFGGAFCRYGFQAGSGGGLFVDFYAFWHFLAPFWGVFWDKKVKKWSMEKQAKK